MPATTASQPLVLRLAGPADLDDLVKLAILDSSHLGPGPHLVAEVGGELQAAVSLGDGAAIADPFRPTAGVVALLRARARAQAPEARRRLRLPHARRVAPAGW